MTRAAHLRPPVFVRPRQGAPARPRDELQAIRQACCALVIVAAFLQTVFFFRAEGNLWSTLLALTASLLGITASLDGGRFRAQPISALILLFYTTTATAGALLVKTMEWSPLSDRLTVPVETFSMLLATQVVLLIADRVYFGIVPLQNLRSFLSRRVLVPIGLMRWPSDSQLWLLGLLGAVSVMLTGTDYQSDASFGLATAGEKLIRAFGFLKYAPFLIPFRSSLSSFAGPTRVPLVPLVAYFSALVVISFATNSRSTFADALPTIGICVLMAKAFGHLDLRRVPPARLLIFGLVAVFGSLLLSRIALAMVVVREYRYGVDVWTLVQTTVEALFNDEWLASAKAKMDTATYVGDYSETYVDSRFFARFLLTKYHDNILYYISLFGDDHIHAYKQFMWERLITSFPDPLLHLFGISINKEDLVISNGDYIVYMIDGWGLGGFKTGSMIAEVFAIFTWQFPFVMLGAALLLFVFHDAFVTPSPSGRLIVSPLILLLIWNLVGTTAAFGLGAETVTVIPGNILRGLPQTIFVYLIATALVRRLTRSEASP